MTLSEVINKTHLYLQQYPLPGVLAHRRLAPQPARINVVPDASYRAAAVLMLLHEENGICHLSFIRRITRAGDQHSGQIAFPGGQIETSDQSLFQTAIRESKEELGIQPADVHFITQMTSIHIPVSKFSVTPFLAYTNYRPDIQIQIEEVEEYLAVPLNQFTKVADLPTTDIKKSFGLIKKVPYFPLGNSIIWGATAMMLAELVEMIKKH